GKLGLPDARRPQEDERARGALRVLQPRPGPAYGPGHGLDRVVLADDPLVQLVLHAEQLLGLLLGELEHRDAGPGRQNLGDLLLVHLGQDVHLSGLPLALPPLPLLAQLVLLVAKRRGAPEVLGVDGPFLTQAGLRDLLVDLANVRWRGHPSDPHAGAGLVYEVDGLVRRL